VPARRRELRDVRHPLRPDLRVERVIVCPSGVHVVTSLAVAGAGTGAGGEPASPAAVAASRTTADLVAVLLPQRYRDRVRPVLCRVDDVAMAELVDDVLVTAPSTLEHIVASSPVVLSTSEVSEVATCLDARMEAFPVPTPPRRRRWSLRRVLLSVVAASSGVAVLVLAHGVVGGVPLP
jgi:hypothetical protein